MAVFCISFLLSMTAFDDMEDKWWIDRPHIYASYNELPSGNKWLVRQTIDDPLQPEGWLEVCVDQHRHLLPESYIAPLMLLNIQELSCMAESFSTYVDSYKRTELWRNIHFIWLLQESLLTAPMQEYSAKPTNRCHPNLERWTIRFMHGISNSKLRRKENAKKLCGLYDAYDGVGKMEKGIFAVFAV